MCVGGGSLDVHNVSGVPVDHNLIPKATVLIAHSLCTITLRGGSLCCDRSLEHTCTRNSIVSAGVACAVAGAWNTRPQETALSVAFFIE